MDLLEWAERQRTPQNENTIRLAFEKFHGIHPEVYDAFERFAFEAINAGHLTIGSKAVWERLRWETDFGSLRHHGEHFRLNNNYTAYYARLFMENHPNHSEVFRTRKVRS